ncbi:MAG: hypothetical protein JJT95_11275 [Pararhodobacter sp.]|nr:hypothetical protein [Pararhodobacter sp.]
MRTQTSRHKLAATAAAAALAFAALIAPREAAAQDQYGNPGVAALEDCLALNPAQVQAAQEGGSWKLVQGSRWLFDFGSDADSEEQANMAHRVVQHYGIDQSCFVGRPNPPMNYLLSGRSAPQGSIPGEDCIGFNAGSLEVRADGSRWLMTDGNSRMVMFDDAAEAHLSLFLVQYYGFTHQCFVGRPNPPLRYWRR